MLIYIYIQNNAACKKTHKPMSLVCQALRIHAEANYTPNENRRQYKIINSGKKETNSRY